MPDDFVHLHTHCHASAFDGLGKPWEFCSKAAEMGQPALALTDHGTLRGLYEASGAADDAGIKLIPGAEFYLADDAAKKGLDDAEKAAILAAHPRDPDEARAALKRASAARKERDHVTVWATDDVGLRNLYRLMAWSWGPGFYSKPRIDLDLLCSHSEGLAVSSGCPNGVVAKLLRSPSGTSEAIARASRLAEVFGDRFLVEIMPHVPEEDCRDLARKLVRLSDRFGATLVATQDAHYPHAHDAAAQEALLCIHTRSTMDSPDRLVFDERDYWLKTRPELEAAFAAKLPLLGRATVNRALDATVAFAERCSAKIARPRPGAYLVAPPLPAGVHDYQAWLMRLCSEGIRERFGVEASGLGAEYLGRLRHELRTIQDLDFGRYFIAVWEVRAWSRSVGIMCGPGRGSGAGSLVCYLLRITDLDPVRHGLMFERFLSPGRTDLPDIDLDFESLRRQEVIDHLRDLYGDDRVAHISTHNTLGGKRAARDLGRIFSVPEREVSLIASLVSDGQDGETKSEDTLAQVLRGTDAGRAFADRYPDLASVAHRLEGQLRDVGIHAAGVVMSSVPLADIVPMESREAKTSEGAEGDLGIKGRIKTIAYDMGGVEAVGLVKLDVLGLTTLSMLRAAFEAAGASPEDIDLDDPETLAGFTSGRFAGIFQFDTASSRRLCRGFAFRRFSDVAVITALNRPGPAKTGLAREFMLRAVDPSRVKPVNPVYDSVMADTYGVPVYQEQIVSLARGFRYSPREADGLRKKIAKKLGLSDEEPKFVAGAVDAGMDSDAAIKLFESLSGFAAYGFNRAHAFSYAALGVWSMWLKVHHPAAFFAAALQFASRPEVQMRLAAEARRCGVPVRPPDVNVAGAGFMVRGLSDGSSEIVGAVGDLKGVGAKTAKAIADAAPYSGLMDFYARSAGAKARVTAANFEALAKAGALRTVFGHHRFAAVNSRQIWEGLRRGQEPVIGAMVPDYSDGETLAVVGEVWPLYQSLAGRSAFDGLLETVRDLIPREILAPGDSLLVEQGSRIVVGISSTLKLYKGDDGGSSGRAILCSAEGDELVLRVDRDVLDSSALGLTTSGRVVICLITISERGNASLDRAWPVAGVIDGADASAKWLVAPARTRPRDVGAGLSKAEEGATFSAAGQVVRIRRHADKSGREMLTLGLLSETGFARVLVFSKRASAKDIAGLSLGQIVRLRLTRLSGLAACLGDSEIELIGA